MRRLKTQRRGKGTFRYLSNRDSVGKIRYPFNYTLDLQRGEIVDIMHNVGKSAPLAKILLEDKTVFYVPASEGSYVGQAIEVGSNAEVGLNNVLPIGKVPLGFTVYNLEIRPGSGGNFFRAGGSYGVVIGSDENGVFVKMKSGEKKLFDQKSLCTLGVVSGSGRTEKPLMKAGNMHFAMKAKGGRIYPRVRGSAMNSHDHPHGGSGHNSRGRKKNVSGKFGAPGQKVGSFAAKRSGRLKK